MESIDFISIIYIAFFGSFGHCIGMCGGIVIAYSTIKIDTSWSKKHQSTAHILYSFGRVTTYIFFGAFFGWLGSVVSFSNLANGILLIIAGVIMIIVGFSLSGKIKFLTLIEHSIQNSSWYHNSFRRILKSEFLGSFYLLGLLNGLLPCGFVYFFAITASSSASAIDGATIMAIFGISTIPAMFSLGFFIGIFRDSSIRDFMIKLATLGVLIYGIHTIYNGYNYITNPNKSILKDKNNIMYSKSA
ncbi:membrane protein, putative [hydrothermal vent metagenome]|uniref:Membrane protein, putative n=1 Tax=hydrothermal vent metagenome TaxID=652676 RepID=A0A1W1EHI2_9ZZZZ